VTFAGQADVVALEAREAIFRVFTEDILQTFTTQLIVTFLPFNQNVGIFYL
jgi:hypothetical protein